ncbi:hypothetical protein Vadar_020306 [Vaccinium darrowii]|uniref:Uncharacterized protein n=1 Tax=Vaccinium darrowii TaxID=229202 RepID=A0ACB7YFY6_9ERIC|nr:hypothetical protein Vadar_020306 [Vaccinium darrowii]
MSSPDIAGMLENSEELDRLRRVQQEVLLEINTMHDKIRSATPDVLRRYGDDLVTRLKMLYTQAKELAESEVSVLKSALKRALKPKARRGEGVALHMGVIKRRTLKRRVPAIRASSSPSEIEFFKSRPSEIDFFFSFPEPKEPKRRQLKADSDISMHSPSVGNHLDTLSSLTGEQIAARVTEGAEKDQWVVAKVTHFARESGEVEVLDEEPGDDEEGGSQRKYKLPVSDIIPFPKRNDISGARYFRPREKVLAVYPDTTTLYKATVVRARKWKTKDYVLEFDDDEDDDGVLPQIVVPFYWVVGLPEGRIIAAAHKGRK